MGVQQYGKISYLRTPPDPDSARIRILFYNDFPFLCLTCLFYDQFVALRRYLLISVESICRKYIITQYQYTCNYRRYTSWRTPQCVQFMYISRTASLLLHFMYLSGTPEEVIYIYLQPYVSFWGPEKIDIEIRIKEQFTQH